MRLRLLLRASFSALCPTSTRVKLSEAWLGAEKFVTAKSWASFWRFDWSSRVDFTFCFLLHRVLFRIVSAFLLVDYLLEFSKLFTFRKIYVFRLVWLNRLDPCVKLSIQKSRFLFLANWSSVHFLWMALSLIEGYFCFWQKDVWNLEWLVDRVWGLALLVHNSSSLLSKRTYKCVKL